MLPRRIGNNKHTSTGRSRHPVDSTVEVVHYTAPFSGSKFTCQFASQASSPRQPTTRIPMRLSHFFVVVAAAFLATGALADNNVASVSEPSHRNLRKHHTIEDEERGIKDIPLERLRSLGRKVGVSADDVLDDAAAAMSTMTKTQQKNWMAGLNKLKSIYKKAPQYGRIKHDS